MKRVLLIAFFIFSISSVCFAGKVAYEPETPTTASFSATDQYATSFITFVNYARNDGENQYWIRFTIQQDNNKLLYNASLNIDGTTYDLQPVCDITTKYHYAAYSDIDHDLVRNISGAQPFRYYDVPPAVVDKIESAKKITFIYSKIDKLDVKVPFYDNYLQNIKSVIRLKYADLPTYFHPEIAK